MMAHIRANFGRCAPCTAVRTAAVAARPAPLLQSCGDRLERTSLNHCFAASANWQGISCLRATLPVELAPVQQLGQGARHVPQLQ